MACSTLARERPEGHKQEREMGWLTQWPVAILLLVTLWLQGPSASHLELLHQLRSLPNDLTSIIVPSSLVGRSFSLFVLPLLCFILPSPVPVKPFFPLLFIFLQTLRNYFWHFFFFFFNKLMDLDFLNVCYFVKLMQICFTFDQSVTTQSLFDASNSKTRSYYVNWLETFCFL